MSINMPVHEAKALAEIYGCRGVAIVCFDDDESQCISWGDDTDTEDVISRAGDIALEALDPPSIDSDRRVAVNGDKVTVSVSFSLSEMRKFAAEHEG